MLRKERKLSNHSGRKTKLIFLLVLFITTSVKGFEWQPEKGQELYKEHCMRCHGTDGTKGHFGAKNLKRSVLSDLAIAQRIQKGKGFMPSFKKKFPPNELEQLVSFIKSLRKI